MADVDAAYAGVGEYRASLLMTGTTDNNSDDEIQQDLIATTRYLEHRLGRVFLHDAVDVTRLFMPGNIVRRRTNWQMVSRQNWAESENPAFYGGTTRILDVDDLVSVTSIKIDQNYDGSLTAETPIPITDYLLRPLNAALGPEPQPYTEIELTQWGGTIGFPPGRLVQVIGKWGWPAVPFPIKRACIELTAIKRLQSPRSTGRIDEFGNTIDMSGQTRNMIDELVRHYGKVSL